MCRQNQPPQSHSDHKCVKEALYWTLVAEMAIKCLTVMSTSNRPAISVRKEVSTPDWAALRNSAETVDQKSQLKLKWCRWRQLAHAERDLQSGMKTAEIVVDREKIHTANVNGAETSEANGHRRACKRSFMNRSEFEKRFQMETDMSINRPRI